MFQLYKNIQTDFLGQIFLELFQCKTRSLFFGHPVFRPKLVHTFHVFRADVKKICLPRSQKLTDNTVKLL